MDMRESWVHRVPFSLLPFPSAGVHASAGREINRRKFSLDFDEGGPCEQLFEQRLKSLGVAGSLGWNFSLSLYLYRHPHGRRAPKREKYSRSVMKEGFRPPPASFNETPSSRLRVERTCVDVLGVTSRGEGDETHTLPFPHSNCAFRCIHHGLT